MYQYYSIWEKKYSPFILPYLNQFVEFTSITLNSCRLLNPFDFNLTWISMWFLSVSVGIRWEEKKIMKTTILLMMSITHIYLHYWMQFNNDNRNSDLNICYISCWLCFIYWFVIFWRLPNHSWRNNSSEFQQEIPKECHSSVMMLRRQPK